MLSFLFVTPLVAGAGASFPLCEEDEHLTLETLRTRPNLNLRNTRTTPEEEDLIVEALCHPESSIQAVWFENINWNNFFLQKIIGSFNPLNLQQVCFVGFVDFPVQSLLSFLQKPDSILNTFSLQKTPLSETDFTQLCESLKDLPSLKSLSLMENDLGQIHIPSISLLFESKSLAYLNLEENVIREGAISLATALKEKSPPGLTDLTIAANEIDEKGIVALTTAVEDVNKTRPVEAYKRLTLLGSAVQGKGPYEVIIYDSYDNIEIESFTEKTPHRKRKKITLRKPKMTFAQKKKKEIINRGRKRKRSKRDSSGSRRNF